ncbi:MAG: PilZ domain-containing protein [Candidatus Sulfotelmatobacter sp.]|jgi:hypothetical protein
MDAINTRRWPRHHVHLPVFIAGGKKGRGVVVPGLACELSRSGMELYGGLNLQLGELVEVEFQVADKTRVGGVVRNRTGFCFGVEFRVLLAEPSSAKPSLVKPSLPEPSLAAPSLIEPSSSESLLTDPLFTDPLSANPEATPDRLEALIVQRHEAYLRQLKMEFEQSLQTMVEMRKCRKAIERIADALDKGT